jgi:cathepsin F/cysteine peptidase B
LIFELLQMKSVLLLVAVLAVCTSASLVDEWKAWKVKYNKTYASAEEEASRLKIFEANTQKAAELQKRNPHARFGGNVYMDMSAKEFKIRHSAEAYFRTDLALRAKKPAFTANMSSAAPQSFDWRARGAVTGIKNQGQCGSCWSFSTTGNIEGQWAIAGHGLTSLSEQELVSCDTTDSGCQGGLPTNAFQWLISAQSGQIVTEGTYPYVSGDGYAPPCALGGQTVGAQIAGFRYVTQAEGSMINWLVTYGPISIGVDAETWQTYGGGVMTDCYGTSLDHAVLIVGYDLSASPAYWIVKNQWGTSWGEGGYILLQYGTNQCGITQDPTSAYV